MSSLFKFRKYKKIEGGTHKRSRHPKLIVDEDDIKIITIPVGYTHNIENIGDDEMILAIWCNELFDEKFPDTYFKKVERKSEKKGLILLND